MKPKSLEKIRNLVVKCTQCSLCKTRLNAVPGIGNPKSEIIFIGEAPGRWEDKVGEPFVGQAGKKLTAALEFAGFSRESIYITNLVKCRPPKNRIPKTEEREQCKKYLEAEIDLIKPKIICVLGNTAFHTILGGNNITKYRGNFIKKNDLVYFITVHPAAVIYNPELMNFLKKDMKKLAKRVKEFKSEKTF